MWPMKGASEKSRKLPKLSERPILMQKDGLPVTSVLGNLPLPMVPGNPRLRHRRYQRWISNSDRDGWSRTGRYGSLSAKRKAPKAVQMRAATMTTALARHHWQRA